MNDKVRENVIAKFGVLMMANAELATINQALGEEIVRLKAELDKRAQPSLPLNDQPSNPYELPKPNGVH